MFFIEKNSRGWAGSFRLTDSKEVVQIMPDRHEPGVTQLELWPENETVGASADTDGVILEQGNRPVEAWCSRAYRK